MDLLKQLFDALIHLSPDSVNHLAEQVGPGLYVILFAIVFAETGLVVTPFLPGDSLLFAVGAVAASATSPISIGLTSTLLIVAAVLGDAVNYAAGHYIGPRVFSREDSWLLNRKHLLEAQRFYEQYGGLTIILARFMPIIRTFAPFVAGIGRMSYPRFALYNVTGGIAWVLLFLLGGWWFGAQEIVKKNFHLVIFAIIFISVLPPIVQYLINRSRSRSVKGLAEAVPASAPAVEE
ncbi:Inner membrane protein YqjA [Aquisphaera giovannonii]|uniref:Inner membrane protein YqjA n=1 Tax=Aquisphaera giovannonii TaxID=406548 RepID=A0A5B9W8A0_9BACT|nr:DedA family protein [Aquisphaera giovannonii]QEH36916.1 Inner membrane protein YqjA [Aquisphaera giovannonii]